MICFAPWIKFFHYLIKPINLLFILITFCNLKLPAQKNKALNNVVIYNGETRVNLNRFNEFHIVYHKTSQGRDSISTEAFCKEIRSRRDTLYAKPTDVTTFRLMDTLRPYTESKYYPESTNVWLRIPAKEIEYIKAKRQPINRISSTILSVSYVTLLCSPFIAMSGNAQVSNFGINLFLVSVPVLAVSWTCNSIWGKKKYRFDPQRSKKETWELSR